MYKGKLSMMVVAPCQVAESVPPSRHQSLHSDHSYALMHFYLNHWDDPSVFWLQCPSTERAVLRTVFSLSSSLLLPISKGGSSQDLFCLCSVVQSSVSMSQEANTQNVESKNNESQNGKSLPNFKGYRSDGIVKLNTFIPRLFQFCKEPSCLIWIFFFQHTFNEANYLQGDEENH